jgi:hypothetical protein
MIRSLIIWIVVIVGLLNTGSVASDRLSVWVDKKPVSIGTPVKLLLKSSRFDNKFDYKKADKWLSGKPGVKILAANTFADGDSISHQVIFTTVTASTLILDSLEGLATGRYQHTTIKLLFKSDKIITNLRPLKPLANFDLKLKWPAIFTLCFGIIILLSAASRQRYLAKQQHMQANIATIRQHLLNATERLENDIALKRVTYHDAVTIAHEILISYLKQAYNFSGTIDGTAVAVSSASEQEVENIAGILNSTERVRFGFTNNLLLLTYIYELKSFISQERTSV